LPNVKPRFASLCRQTVESLQNSHRNVGDDGFVTSNAA